jgi:hypothetical protein
MPISYNNGDLGVDIRGKINGGFGIESGAMESPYELVFSIYHRIRTLTVDADIEIGLSSGLISNTFETLITTGDGSHALTFDVDIVMLGDAFNPDKIQCIDFRYIAGTVIGVITTIADASFPPGFTSATMVGEESGTQTLDLVFDAAVTITTAGWTVSASGGAVTVSSVSSGSGTTAPKLSLSRAIGSSETITVSYDSSTGATVATSGGAELVDLSAEAVTNNVYEILLSVPFTGTTVDTGKGTITNPDSANLTISQNGKLLFTRTTDTAVTSSITNYWGSVSTYNRGVFSVVMNDDTGFLNSFKVFQYRVDANNDIAILSSTSAALCTIRVRSGGVTTYTLDTGISLNQRFRIRFTTANDIIFEYWSGSAWTQLGVTQPAANHATLAATSAANIRLSTNSSASDVAADVFSFDELYITDKVYNTVTP